MNDQKIQQTQKTKVDMFDNTVAGTLFVIGIIEIATCFIVGLIQGVPEMSYDDHNWGITLIWWVAGFISGMMIIGFAEVIKQLQTINNKIHFTTVINSVKPSTSIQKQETDNIILIVNGEKMNAKHYNITEEEITFINVDNQVVFHLRFEHLSNLIMDNGTIHIDYIENGLIKGVRVSGSRSQEIYQKLQS